MNKTKTKLLAMGLVAAFVVASCGGSSSSTDTEASTDTVATTDTVASEEGNSLTDAWANDWAIAGLENPGIAVSDWAIEAVDTSGFKKDGPYKIGSHHKDQLTHGQPFMTRL